MSSLAFVGSYTLWPSISIELSLFEGCYSGCGPALTLLLNLIPGAMLGFVIFFEARVVFVALLGYYPQK
jgi:hypothetical protein